MSLEEFEGPATEWPAPETAHGRELIVAMVGEHRGTARVFSGANGEAYARDRAEAQARDKWRKAQS